MKTSSTAKVKRWLKSLGPGLITGASDDDPSGIATYSQAGAQFGLGAIWTSLFSLPFMIAIQEMCGRIGIVKGEGLSKIIKDHYGRTVTVIAVTLLVVANTFNIAADLGAMASALKLLVSLPFTWLIIIITTLTLVCEIFIPYKTYAKYLKYLTLTLFAYIATAIIVTGSWRQTLSFTILPDIQFTKEYLMVIVAILGTTISPYLFFWQTSEEVEEEIVKRRLLEMDSGIPPHIKKHDIGNMRVDTTSGMIFSNLIMFFIISTAAHTLFIHGINTVGTASEAAEALRPFGGMFTFLLFTLGIIGTGLLAVPILAGSASYAVSEALGWREGLYRKPNRAPGFYAVITAAIIAGLFINFFTSVEPFTLLYYAAVLNGLCAPPLMFIILHIANREDVMGEHTNSDLSNWLGYIITGIMTACAIALIVMH
jgi:NRAMP (natural resistance-associated macrophage protein)-like metal ion transporter